jgi:hypothetical protein
MLSLVLAGTAYTGGNQAVLEVHRCVAADGRLSYQQQPCAASAREARVLELDLRAPPVPEMAAEAEPRTRAKRQSRKRTRQAASRAAPSRRSPVAAIPACPPTREHPGDTGLGSLKTAWKHHIHLPGETYLKNAGRWPQHCMRR